MNRVHARVFSCGLSLLAAASIASPAFAGHHGHHRYSEADGEIDKLDGDIYLTRDGWELEIRCTVDVEDARFDDRFELNVRLSDPEGTVRVEGDRPLVVRIALDFPTKVHDDQNSYRRTVRVRLPRAAIGYPGKVRLNAELVQCSTGKVMDAEDEAAHFHRKTRR